MRSIRMLSKMWDADEKFVKEASSNHRKGKMQMQFNMPGRLKSICKFKEKQVADTAATKRASATMNIKALQIHQLSKKHLRQQITPGYRYIKSKKSKSPHRSAYFNHGTPQSKKRLCNPANWSRACPTKLSRSA